MKVINFFGAPSSGKSTLAAKLYSQMKIARLKVEITTEFAKDLIYDNSNAVDDQIFVTSTQYHKLFTARQNNLDFVITDSPIMLGVVYSNLKSSQPYDKKAFAALMFSAFQEFNNINILIKPEEIKDFQNYGRKHDKESSIKISQDIKKMLDEYKISYIEFNFHEHEKLLDLIQKIS